jgi:hypothetical protein
MGLPFLDRRLAYRIIHYKGWGRGIGARSYRRKKSEPSSWFLLHEKPARIKIFRGSSLIAGIESRKSFPTVLPDAATVISGCIIKERRAVGKERLF